MDAQTVEPNVRLIEIAASYEHADLRRSPWQLSSCLIPYFGMLALMYASLDFSYGITLAIAIPASGFLVRVFVIMHDCSHGSFFRSRKANNIVGTLLGILLFTPYYNWRRRHSLHHATSSNLDRRGWWDISTLTVKEYAASSWLQRFGYRLYRRPLVLFLIGPLAFFLVIQRFSPPGANRSERRHVGLTNLALFGAILGRLAIGLNHSGMRNMKRTIIVLSAFLTLVPIAQGNVSIERAGWPMLRDRDGNGQDAQ